jgi:CPA1 family monovalent cation:H+ antiporter
MLIEHILLALVLILGLSIIAQPISRWLHMPEASILVVLGFIVSELVIYAGFDTGLRADNFQALIFYIFIPILVFESAYNLDKQALKSNLVVILVLAIIAMLLTCCITAVLLFYGVGHEAGFPWLAALITGAIVAATDPVAVVAKLKELNAPHRLSVLLEGESLFNDATAIVLFGLFLSMAVAAQSVGAVVPLNSATDIFIKFITIFIGGGLTGLVIGIFFGLLQKLIKKNVVRGAISLVVAYGSYIAAEHLMVSGVMSTLIAAISFSILSERYHRQRASSESTVAEIKYLWNVLAHIANVSVFLVMGAVITIDMFEHRWLAMLIAIFALLIARAVSVYGVLSIFSLFKELRVPLASQTVMVWGGLRGAVTLALALSLPTSLDYWWTIQSIAFGVVIFSLFVQAPTMKMLTTRLLGKESNL